MKRVLLDTGVWLSVDGAIRQNDKRRINKARCIFNYLKNHDNDYEICYSERNEREIKKYINSNILLNSTKLPSHILNQTWNETEEKWGNINSMWGDPLEFNYGNKLENALPRKGKNTNKNDRGIYGDAVYGKCLFFIHENPRDFKKLNKIAINDGITLVDLLKTEYSDVVKLLEVKMK